MLYQINIFLVVLLVAQVVVFVINVILHRATNKLLADVTRGRNETSALLADVSELLNQTDTAQQTRTNELAAARKLQTETETTLKEIHTLLNTSDNNIPVYDFISE
jgi:uncharacterized protein YlxW (UPF0749 family)